MIRTIIVEDEEKGRHALIALLNDYCPEIEITAVADSTESALQIVERAHPDLLFLDIEMPGGSGFHLLERLEKIDFEVIFTTAHEEYAIKAIKCCALDYLLKPVDVDELVAAVKKVKNSNKGKDHFRNFENLLRNLKTGAVHENKIALPVSEGFDFVMIENITRCEANGNYTEVYLKTGEKMTVTRTLKEYEEILEDYGFCRVHDKHLINMRQVKKYIKGEGGYVIMDNGNKADVSKRRKQEFLNRLTRP